MDELKTQAMIAEIEQQRNWALTRCAQLVAEMAVMQAKIKELEKPKEEPKEV